VKFWEFEQKWKRGSAPKEVWRMRDKVSEKRKVEKSFVEDIIGFDGLFCIWDYGE